MKQLNEQEYLEFIEQWKRDNKELIDSGKCRHIFLECLPKKGKYIDWMNTLYMKVYYIYENIKDWIEIIEIIKSNKTKLKIKYKNKECIISTDNFHRCKLGKILNKITKEFKVEIGQIFKDNKRNLIIIDREYKQSMYYKNTQLKYYKYKCNKCKYDEGWIEEKDLLHGQGCGCCNGKVVVKGINDISTTNPEMVKYFANIEDSYNYTYSSGERINFKCPNCGFEKEMIISNLYKFKFSCPNCSDGVSYPEKFIYNLLKQLKENNQLKDFVWQYTKINNKWVDSYRYDFYFKKDNEEYIIETHGEQHYRKCTNFKLSLEEEQENDKNKYELAIDNGIKDENYIVIDCRKSDLNFIKNNILHSKLNELFNLRDIDWIKIGQDCETSLVKEVCEYWHLHNEINNEDLTTGDLGKIFKLNYSTIRNYLKKGNSLDWCGYDTKEEIMKNKNRMKFKSEEIRSKKIEVFKDGISLGVFPSIKILSQKSEKIFGIKLIRRYISEVANNKQQQYKGFTFKFL